MGELYRGPERDLGKMAEEVWRQVARTDKGQEALRVEMQRRKEQDPVRRMLAEILQEEGR